MVMLFVAFKLKFSHTRVHIGKIVSTNRRFVSQAKRQRCHDDYHTDPLPTDIDNHADTICFGKNFRPLFFTSEVCTVSPFLENEYDAQNNVQICSAVTAVDLDSGETILLEAGQGLWFGDRMARSLINPNQLRAFGIPVCDDPTDPNRALGIYLEDEYFVPMQMSGSTCTFNSRCPSNEELESCRTFIVSDPDSWDPTEDMFISSVERGEVYESRTILQVSTMLHDNVYFSNSDYIHEYDKAHMRSGLGPGIFERKLCANVFTDKRHHGSNPELLSQKWGIGLKKAKDTIKNTTQLNIRSAILPLTRRYRTDLVSQRL